MSRAHTLPRREAAARPGLLRRVIALESLRRQRRALERMTDRQLDDLGLSRAAAAREASRPVWDAPETWRC